MANIFTIWLMTDTEFEKNNVKDVAGTVNGVVESQNNISASEQWIYRSDRKIKCDIENQLPWSNFVDSNEIKVNVALGAVRIAQFGHDKTVNKDS